MHRLDRLQRRDAAGADRPDGFIGDGQPVGACAFGQRGEQLGSDHFVGIARIAHGERFAHAQDHLHARGMGGDRLGGDISVGLAARLAPFAMAGDDPGRPRLDQHLGRQRAGIGAAQFHMAVLGADEGRALQLRPGHDQRGRQAKPDFHRRMLRGELADRLHLVEMRAHPVHLPVADHQLAPAHRSKSPCDYCCTCPQRVPTACTASPGSAFRQSSRWTAMQHLSRPSATAALAAGSIRP